jgi:RHS repeat-associated protein
VAGYETCSTNSLGGVTQHEYDGFARRVKTANNANGRELESVTTYHADGSVATVGEVTVSGTNTTSYSVRQDVAGKPGAYKITVTDPQGKQTVNYYSGDGHLYRSEGATYPVAYVKNPAGQMAQLHTWRDENSDPDITRWYYDPFTGAVTNKLYADGKGTVYSYLADGRVSTREWAQGITTTYGYVDIATGSIRTTEYSDTTPSVTNCYNLSGQLIKVEDGSGTTTFGYDSKGRQSAETNELAIITRSYDTYGRYTGYTLNPACHAGAPGGGGFSIHYSYDIFNRLSSVISVYSVVTNQFNYSYIPGTQLVSGYTASSSISTNLTVTRTYETVRNLITAITNSVGSVPSVVSAFTYSNDSTGKRTSRADYYNGSTVTNTFGYNERDEVTNAVMNSSDYSYVFDDIGNRTTSTVDSVSSVYTANQLNQYTAITGGISVSPVHDDDGNLTYDGSAWHHTWDAENRLIKSEPNTVTNGAYMLEYTLNYNNLRVEKTVRQLSGRDPSYPMDPQSDPGTWDAIETRRYIWDGFNIAAEIIIDHVTAATNISYYTWGLDLSGGMQGAGGVGGLLSDTKVTSTGANFYYSVSDGNGNVTEYIDENGTVVAHGEYSAFGEAEFSGSMKDDFTHWFSTKPLDVETGLVQYEFRPYVSVLGSMLSRDPLQEAGGFHLYRIGVNNLLNNIDALGLFDLKKNWKTLYYNKLRKYGIIPDAAARAYIALIIAKIQELAGDDPWIVQFLVNYFFGEGNKIKTLTKEEVKSINLFEDIYNFYREDPNFFKKNRLVLFETSSGTFATKGFGPGNLTLGEFRIDYKGRVNNCNFKGQFRINDRFNFNWGNRNPQGEFRLRLFTLLTSGIPFDVDSEWIDIHQNYKDGMASWR